MKNALQIITVLVLIICASSMNAQQNKVEYVTTSTKIKKLGKTKPISELINKSTTSKEKKEAYKMRKKAPDNFIGRGGSNAINHAAEHQGPDAVLQSKMGKLIANDPLVNVDGLLGGGSPHDPSGDIGTTHYMQAINGTRVGVYDKNGSQVSNFSANTLWSEFNISGRGDPIILFDEMSNRWFITEFANPANVLIAISDTEDPLGSYNAYNFSTPNFPDYPKYAVWPNALVFTSNEGGPGALHNYFIDRVALLAGEDEVTMQRIQLAGSFATQAGFFVTTPLDFNGDLMPLDSRPLVMKLNDSSWSNNVPEDRLELFAFDIDWENEANTTVERTDLVTTPYDGYPCSESGFGFQCVPQLGGGGLDAIPEVVMNVPQFRNFGTHQSIVLSFVTDATQGQNQSAIRWMELRKSGLEDWSIYQEGTYAPDGLDRYMSSIAIDKFGNIGLGYNVSSPDMYVGIRYTGRFVDDPLGEMTFEEVNVVDGLGPIISGGRFGDYAQMGVDPNDGVTFWYTTEYAHINRSRTRLVAFQLQKNNIDASPLAITNPITGPDLSTEEQITVTVSNAGLEDLENLTIGLLYEGNTISTFTIPETLSEDDTYEHTFDTPIDMSEYETYEIGTFTSIETDENMRNDTLYTMVSRVAVIDGGLGETANIETCNDNRTVNVRVTNTGTTDLTEVGFEISANGTVSGNDTFVGEILIGESAMIPVKLAGLIEGDNDVSISISSVNGEDDINISNNTTNLTVSFIDERFEYTLLLTTDTYPEETSWTITDSDGNVIAEGGSYDANETLFTEYFCLEDGQCYNFEIIDSGGDGICCGFGAGSYEVIDGEGNPIFSSNGQFSSSQNTELCAGAPCSLSVETETTKVSNEGAADGSILFTATGGNGPYMYSIDEGLTFQENPLFEGLAPGEYSVVVTTADEGCDYVSIVTVELSTSVIDIDGSYSINVSPNPSEGFYHVSINNLKTTGYSMKMQVINSNGRLIQEMPLQKYNDVFEGDLSLIAYPSGIYYIRFLDKEINHLARLVKI